MYYVRSFVPTERKSTFSAISEDKSAAAGVSIIAPCGGIQEIERKSTDSSVLLLPYSNINLWHICGMKMPQTALRDVKRREAGMQKSQCFQGLSARYEKRHQAQIGPHNPKVVGSNPSSATISSGCNGFEVISTHFLLRFTITCAII